MATLFREKLKNKMLVYKRKQSMFLTEAGNIRTSYYAVLENKEQIFDLELPYSKVVDNFIASLDTFGSKIKRIFIVADTESEAIKTAFSIAIVYYYDMQAGYIEPGEDDDKFGDIFNKYCSKIRLVNMSEQLNDSEKGNNLYATMVQGMSWDESVLFSGLVEDEKLESRLDVLKGFHAGLQFVMIKPDQLEKPWVRELMMDYDCELIKLPKKDIRQYIQITNELLDGERYSLNKSFSTDRLVRKLMKSCDINRFDETYIAWSLDMAVKQASIGKKRYTLEERDFSLTGKEDGTPMDRLEALVGLSNVKQVMKELSAFMKEMSHNEKLTNVCRHMIFEGNPGTGKTVCAKITADIMAEMGQSNSVFVDASRKDIVAGYVGQTAPKIANLFKRARGGVLFVDEAGFFLQDAKGSYNQEAIKEFVRYMELYQDVIVIFALYPHEVEDWLDLEAGLSSRISRIVKFEDYSDKEMIEIAHYMCEQRGYCTEQAADSVISDYIAKRKSLDKKKFGNAREVRKLVEAAIFARSIRRYDDNTEDTTLILSKDDFKNGAARLMQESKELKIKNAFGFSMGVAAYGEA
jgi:hypothetical protein